MRELSMKLSPDNLSVASPVFIGYQEEDLPSCTTVDCTVEVNDAMEIVQQEVEVQTSHNVPPQTQYVTLTGLPASDPHTSFYASNPAAFIPVAESSLPAMEELDPQEDVQQRPEGRSLDDMTDVEQILEEANHGRGVSVKVLRSIVPRLMVYCFYKEEDITGKKKVKNLWHTRPAGYPDELPFKDPNNKDCGRLKPGKDDLVKMFDFLKAKYMQMRQRQSVQVLPAVGEPSTMLATACVKSPPPPSPMPPPAQATTQHVCTTDLRRILKQEPESPHTQPGSPLYELHTRIQEKLVRVQDMVDHDPLTVAKMAAVNQDVLSTLYSQTAKVDQCCAFLDAGHQFETLLDVVLAFGKDVAMEMLRSGCTELLDKFVPRQAASQQPRQLDHQVNGMVYLAEADIKPSLAPADGAPFIPTLPSLPAPDLPSVLSPQSQTASDFAQLSINVRGRGSSDRLTQIIEKRDPSPSFGEEQNKNDGMDKIDSVIDELFGSDSKLPEIKSTKYRVPEYHPMVNLAPNTPPETKPSIEEDPTSDDALEDVLSMMQDYGCSDYAKSTNDTLPWLAPPIQTTQARPTFTAQALPSMTAQAPAQAMNTLTAQAPAQPTNTSTAQAPPVAALTEQQLQSLLQTESPQESQDILRLVASQLSSRIPQTVVDFADGEDVEPVSGHKRQHSAQGLPAAKRGRPC